jgi:membrane protease YdiL (CAAX protease family)
LKKALNTIAHHQVAAYIVISFAISWLFFWLNFVVFKDIRIAQALCGKIAAFGPALAAMLVAAVAYPERRPERSKNRLVLFGFVWVFAWVVLLLNLKFILGIPIKPRGAVVFAVVALLPAWVVSGSMSRIAGVRAQFATLWKPRGSAVWYLAAFLIYPIILMIGAAIAALMGNRIAFRHLSPVNSFLLPLIMFLDGYVTSGGTNEESGWRGFLLPRLQKKHSVLIAAVTVWIVWALWHIPYDVGLGTPLRQVLLNRIVFNLLASLLFAWVYNRTNGSIMTAGIFHASMNTAGAFLPLSLYFLVPLVILGMLVIIYDHMWRRLPEGHPACCPAPKTD